MTLKLFRAWNTNIGSNYSKTGQSLSYSRRPLDARLLEDTNVLLVYILVSPKERLYCALTVLIRTRPKQYQASQFSTYYVRAWLFLLISTRLYFPILFSSNTLCLHHNFCLRIISNILPMINKSSFRRGQFAGIIRLTSRDNLTLENSHKYYQIFWLGFLNTEEYWRRVKRALSGLSLIHIWRCRRRG